MSDIQVTVVAEPAEVTVVAEPAALVVVDPAAGALGEVQAEAERAQGVEATLVRFRDLDGNPIPGKVVTVVIDTDTGEPEDIIFEDAP